MVMDKMILTKISGVGLIILSYLFTYNTLPKVGYFCNTLLYLIFTFPAQSNLFQLRKQNRSETKVIDVANLITVDQFDSIITVSSYHLHVVLFSLIIFQPLDE